MINTNPLTKKSGAILFFMLAAIFLLLNRGAYQGYFQDDEIGALAWTRWGSSLAYLEGALTPIYQSSFRAVGFYYFHLLEPLFRLDFARYVAVLHAIHLLNVWLLWLLMRRLEIPARAACAGCVFFALHMALFDAVWKPMYVFDVLCGTFCLLSILLWARGNWILSFISFWLAYKAKEVAVMLPFALVCYEVWFGSQIPTKSRWTRLAPFVAGSLSFAVQALVLHPPDSQAAYAYHFTPAALATTAPFYATRIFFVPYLGFLLPLSDAVARNRRAWFGLAMMTLLFVPLIFLPGRVFNAYCYVPFTGLAIALAAVAEVTRPAVLAAFFLLWLPLDLQWLRTQRNDTLRQDAQIREWITTVGKFTWQRPDVTQFVYDGMPEGFRPFGMEGAVRYFLPKVAVTLPAADSPEGIEKMQQGQTAVLRWDERLHRLDILMPQGGPRQNVGLVIK